MSDCEVCGKKLTKEQELELRVEKLEHKVEDLQYALAHEKYELQQHQERFKHKRYREIL